MMVFDPDLAWPIFGAILAGGAIGMERQHRSSPAQVAGFDRIPRSD